MEPQQHQELKNDGNHQNIIIIIIIIIFFFFFFFFLKLSFKPNPWKQKPSHHFIRYKIAWSQKKKKKKKKKNTENQIMAGTNKIINF